METVTQQIDSWIEAEGKGNIRDALNAALAERDALRVLNAQLTTEVQVIRGKILESDLLSFVRGFYDHYTAQGWSMDDPRLAQARALISRAENA